MQLAQVKPWGRSLAEYRATEGSAVDLEPGLAQGCYRTAALPDLPFPDDAFALGVRSHLLFLYSGQLTLPFHRAALHELSCGTSAHLDRLVAELRAQGHDAEIPPVPYEFQKGGNHMLRIRRGPPKGVMP